MFVILAGDGLRVAPKMGARIATVTKGAGPKQGWHPGMRKWVRSPFYRAVIAKLIDARRKAGLTQRDLAASVGKPPSFIAKVEQGERRLDIVEFIALARALGVKETDLIRAIAADLPKRIEI